MDTNEKEEVYYPLGVQIVSYIGVPALTLVGLWLLSRSLWEQGLPTTQIVPCTALGLSVLYQCAIGWRVLPYLRVRLVATAEHLEIHADGSRKVLDWERFSAPKDYTFAGVTCLMLRNGEVVLYAFDNMKNLGTVKEIIQSWNE